MNIILTSSYPLDHPGGGVIGCLKIAQHLERLGARVILMPVDRHPAPPQILEHISIKPVRPNRLHLLLDGIGIRKGLEDLLRTEKIDAVLGWQHETAFLPGLLKKKKIVFGIVAAAHYGSWKARSTRFKPMKHWVDEWLRDGPLRRADVVFALSKFTQSELIRVLNISPAKVVVAYWGVDPSFMSIRRIPRGLISRFLFWGSLDPIKGLVDALQALAQIQQQGMDNWELKIAGWGDTEGMRGAIRSGNVEDRVVYLGSLNHEELKNELKWADAAILPSHAESFGLAIAEAQASGLPVVAYRTGAVPEIVEDGQSGFLAEPFDIQELADRIIRLIREPGLAVRMGNQGRARVAGIFTWEKTARTMLDRLELLRERV